MNGIPRTSVLALVAAAVALAASGCGCNADDGHNTDAFIDTAGDSWDVGDSPDGGPCTNGDTRCYVLVWQECEAGEWTTTVDCTVTSQLCDDDLGCVDCIPGRNFCEGQDSMECDDTGFGGTFVEDCTAEPGTWCDAASGTCINECEQAAAEHSNIGCEYWAVDLDNADSPLDHAAQEQFAVVVANVNITYSADVWVYADSSGAGEPTVEWQVDFQTVLPGGLHIFRLPMYNVDGEDTTPNYDDGPQTAISKRTYRVVSSVPVVAYQFNPINQAYSNGASLLLPTPGLGNMYNVATWPPANPIAIPPTLPTPNRSYVTVIATADDTTVWVTPAYDIEGSVAPQPEFQSLSPITAGTRTEFYMNRYEVLNLENKSQLTPYPDLTGTIVESTRPVAVFTGQDLAGVGDQEDATWCTPEDHCTCCMEHNEYQVLPRTSMGKEFVISHSPWRTLGTFREPDHFRVLAVLDGTHVTTTLSSLPSFTLNANEWMDFKSNRGFVMESMDNPINVLQLIVVGQQTESGIGDPEMIQVPAVEQRRDFYVFTTGEGFTENYAVISMPDGTFATIDGAVVDEHCDEETDGTLGATTFRSYYCDIADGVHTVDSSGTPVGVYVWGYYGAGSYGYPAGSDLREIFLE